MTSPVHTTTQNSVPFIHNLRHARPQLRFHAPSTTCFIGIIHSSTVRSTQSHFSLLHNLPHISPICLQPLLGVDINYTHPSLKNSTAIYNLSSKPFSPS